MARPLESQTFPNSTQHNLLVIVTDHMELPTPVLRSVWLLINLPSQNSLTFVPLFPASYKNSASRDLILEKSFSLNANGSPSNKFLKNLKQFDFWWDDYVVIDEVSLAKFVDLAGGIKVENNFIKASQIETGAYLSNKDPSKSLRTQYRIIEQLCNKAPLIMIHPDFRNITPFLASHIRSSIPVDIMHKGLLTIYESESIIKCEFPTIQNE